MIPNYRKQTTLEKLKEKYSSKMRRAFKLALTNKKKSDAINAEATILLKEIRYLEHSS